MENNKSKMQAYEQIQAMVQKEIEVQFPKLYQQYADKYGVASVPLHTHNGFDSPKVNAWDLTHSQAASGSITMATNGQRYEIGLNIAKSGTSFAPSQIRFNGIAIKGSGATGIRALVVGDAFIGPSYYLQPLSSSSVTIGGPAQVCVQSSSYILVNDSGAGNPTAALASEGHIVSVEFPGGTVVARATIPDLGDFGANDKPLLGGNLLVDVTLATGWSIIGNFVIM